MAIGICLIVKPARAARISNSGSRSKRLDRTGTDCSVLTGIKRKPHCASSNRVLANNELTNEDSVFDSRRASGIAALIDLRPTMIVSSFSYRARKELSSRGSCCISASIVMTASMFSSIAQRKPVKSAAPLPRFDGCRRTVAPCWRQCPLSHRLSRHPRLTPAGPVAPVRFQPTVCPSSVPHCMQGSRSQTSSSFLNLQLVTARCNSASTQRLGDNSRKSPENPYLEARRLLQRADVR